jgi:hypothetical protein
MAQQTRPEPGIATDDELETAVEALRAAIDDEIVSDLYAERFAALWAECGDETITLHLDERYSATKERAINQAMQSPAPVVVRDLHEGDENKLTFYPTNQAE